MYLLVLFLYRGQFKYVCYLYRDHEDPYSTLVLYTSSSRPPSTNPDDFVESISLTERPTNSDGSRIRNIKYTARLQFDRNKEKLI